MEFVRIPAGTLQTGCPPEQECSKTTPLYRAAFPEGFWMGRTEVTVKQFRRFAEQTGYVTVAEKAGDKWNWRNPGFKQADNHPVIYTSDRDALSYARWAGGDLPTGAEWLYASRAGATTTFYFGDKIDDRYVWHRENATTGTRPVAGKLPNRWGLYDMIGNAYEWVKPVYEPPEARCEVQIIGEPAGGSWTRCTKYRREGLVIEPFPFDLPVLPSKCPQYPTNWDDDRGFRCVRRTAP